MCRRKQPMCRGGYLCEPDRMSDSVKIYGF